MSDRNDAVAMSLAEAKILVMQGMKGDPGESPRISATNGHWEVYDNDTEQWVDTGVTARGPKGDPGSGEGGGSSLPEVTATDEGKVLTVNDQGAWDAERPVSPIPSYTTTADGRVLTIATINGAKGLYWLNPPQGLPSVIPARAGRVLTVSDQGEWVDEAIPKQVRYYRHHTVAFGENYPEHTISEVTSGGEFKRTGAEIYAEMQKGVWPVIEDYGSDAPYVYKPEVVVPNSAIYFKSTDTNGKIKWLNVQWGATTAFSYNSGSALPEPNVLYDVGKVPMVNSSGGYVLQLPEPFEIPVTESGNTYSTNVSAADIIAHRKNLIVSSTGIMLTYDGCTFSGLDYITFYFSARQIDYTSYTEFIHSMTITADTQNNGDTVTITGGFFVNELAHD